MYACQKAAKRKFSTNNYRGKWSEDDEVLLIELVRSMGKTWTKISEELNRTPENCRDKFRELGGVTPEKRKKGKWNLEEKLELIKIISSVCERKFLKRIGS